MRKYFPLDSGFFKIDQLTTVQAVVSLAYLSD
jgi:hypothetical protein